MRPAALILTLVVTALAPVVWGSTYLVTTEFLPPGRPLLASLLRALPAGLILIALGRQLPHGVWWLRAAVLGVLNIGAFFYFLFVAAYHLPGGVAALIMSVQPVIVLLLGALVLSQPVRPVQIVACALAFIGMALVVLQPSAQLDSIGVLAGLAGALSMAGGIVLTKHWGRPEGVGLLTYTGWQLTAGGLFLLPIALLAEGLPTALTMTNLLGFVWLGLIGALVAYALWFRGIARLPALSVSFISLASPLTATVLGYLFLDQRLGAQQLLGGLAVIAAMILAQPRPNPQPGPQSASADPATADPARA